MGAIADWGKVGAFVAKGVDTFSKWLKKSRRRKHVQKFNKAVDKRNLRHINRRLFNLKKKRKDKDDSR